MISNKEINEQESSSSGKQLESRNPNSSWKTVGVRVRSQDLPVLNQRLRLYGFDLKNVISVGYSNGANMASSLLLLRHE